MRNAALSLALLAFAGPLAAQDAALPFDRSLELLEAQQRMTVLATLQSRGFHIPDHLIDKTSDDIKLLAGELDRASGKSIEAMEAWVKETDIARKAENDSMMKLAEQFFAKVLKGYKVNAPPDVAKDPKSGIASKFSIQDWQKAHLEFRKNMLGMDANIEARNLRMYNDMQLHFKNAMEDAAIKPGNTIAKKQFEEGMNRAYRGMLDGRTDTVKRLAEIQKERARIDGSLKMLKQFENGLKVLDFVTATTPERFVLGIQESTLAYLKAKYPGQFTSADEAELKWWGDAAKKIAKNANQIWTNFERLDSNATLRKHPETLKLAKQFAVLEGIYQSTVGILATCQFFQPITPLFDVLDFYGKAVGLIPEFAIKMQGFADKVDQDYLQIRGKDPFNVVPSFDNLVGTPLLKALGVQIASDKPIENNVEGTKFFLIVEKGVAAEGYVTLTREEYDRLYRAVSDERLASAAQEASRGMMDAVWDKLASNGKPSVLAPDAYASYLKNLNSKVRLCPFKSGQLWDLARGKDVLYTITDSLGKSKEELCGAKRFTELRDEELDRLVGEQCVRTALGDVEPKLRGRWYDLTRVLRESNIPLAPAQIFALFRFFHRNEGDEKVLRLSIARIQLNRKLNAEGAVKVGIPLIVVSPELTAAMTGKTAKATATLVVSDLPPGVELAVAGEWILPDWAGGKRACEVKLMNGTVEVTTEIAVPADVKSEAFDVKLKLKIPRKKGIEEISRLLVEIAICLAEPMPKKLDFVEVEGDAHIDLDGAKPGAPTIKFVDTKRQGGTILEVTCDAFDKLDPDGARALLVKIYRAESEAGPFETEDDGLRTYVLAGNTPIQDANQFVTGRVGKTAVRIGDFIASIEKKAPFYYKASVTPGNRLGEAQGDELFSEVLKPGPAILQYHFAGTGNEKPPKELFGDWIEFSVSLGTTHQYGDIQGAVFTAKVKGWTGHFFAAHKSGKQRFGAFHDIGVIGAVAGIKVPYDPAGGEIEITGTAGAWSASAKIPFPANPKIGETAAVEAKRLAEFKAESMKKMAESLDRAKARIPEAEKRLAEVKGDDKNGRAILQLNVHAAKHDAAMLEKYWIPIETARRDVAIAMTNRDRAATVTGLQAMLALEELKAAMESTYAGIQEPLFVQQGNKSNLEDRLKRLENSLEFTKLQISPQIAQAALLAGNAGAFKTAVDQEMAIAKKFGTASKPRYLSSTYYDAADGIAILAGDRAGAAKIWESLKADELGEVKPEERKALIKSQSQRVPPAYFPPGGK